MSNEFIVIKGRLKETTRELLKEQITAAGHTLQSKITKKTTLIVEGTISRRNVKKYDSKIKVISEHKFLELLNKKEEEIKIKEIFSIFSKKNIYRILSLVMIIQSIRYTETIMSLLIAIIASILILPDISNKYYSHLIFKITIPVSLFMIAFAFNFEKEKSKIYGTWYVDTMTFTINKKEIKLDVIDEKGRHLLNGKRSNKDNKTIITTDYKEYYFEYDEENDSLCYLKNKKECAYYLKRID